MPCYAAVKRAAIACIMAVALADAAHAAAGSCKGAAGHLATLIKTHWPSPDDNTAATGGDMIGRFLHKSPSGFTGFLAGATRFKLAEYSQAAFIEQAAQLQHPFTPSRELLKAFEGVQEALVVSDVPGSELFAANSVGGTAHCNSTVFFAVSQRRARLVPSPNSWENDVGGSCGLTRSFASVDGAPFIIDDNLDAGPSLTSTLTLTGWGNGKWLPPCEARFVFAPRFDAVKTLNDWAGLDNWEVNDCGAGGCQAFQRAALDLVRQTQQDRAGVEAHLLAVMTVSQREQYQKLKHAGDRLDPDDVQAGGDDAAKPKTAADLTDTSPLPLPMVVDNRVFLASIGHFTIGGRIFADWKVTVETEDAETTKEIARFAVGMTQGSIVSVSIK